MRFNRSVIATITPKKTGESFAINGLKIQFNITKTIEAAPNRAIINIYNMNPQNRAAVVFKYNLYDNRVSVDPYGGNILLVGGHVGAEKTIFQGDIISAFTVRQGGDYITTIEAMTKAEALNASKINKAFPKNTTYKSILDYVIGELNIPGIKAEVREYIDDLFKDKKISSSETLSGSGLSILDKLNKAFDGFLSMNFDESGLNVRGPGVPSQPNPKFFFSKFTGLIGPPEITNQGANLKVLLEPTVKVSDLVKIESPTIQGTIQPEFVVRQINHIGDNREGDWVTNLNTWYLTSAAEVKGLLG